MKRTESTSSAQVLKKTQPEEFDLVILGGGTGSTIAAWTFAGEGKQVAVVERKYIGGAVPHLAGLPGQKKMRSPELARYFLQMESVGDIHHRLPALNAELGRGKHGAGGGVDDHRNG